MYHDSVEANDGDRRRGQRSSTTLSPPAKVIKASDVAADEALYLAIAFASATVSAPQSPARSKGKPYWR